MNITLQVKNSFTKLNCPKQQHMQRDQSPNYENQKTSNKQYYHNDEVNKMYLLHNVKNLANAKFLRQLIQNIDYYDCSNQLQECMIQTKLNSLKQIKAPVIKTPLQRPINYLSKKTVNLNFKNDLQNAQKSVDVQRKSIQLPKIATKTIIPPPPVTLKKPKKNKKKGTKKQIEKDHIKTDSNQDICKENEENEETEEDKTEQIELNYLIRQEDL
ncbi:hypothetical protein ABPG72_003070 [Tetrahymena utriculariae]